MTSRALIYARVSTDAQRGNYSIPIQLDACQKYVTNRGYQLTGSRFVSLATGQDCTPDQPDALPAYVDDYTSTEQRRPALDALLEHLDDPGADLVVVYVLDRLARDPFIRRTLELQIEARDARVEYVLGQYEDTPEGEVRKDMDATFSKWENAVRSRRTREGKLKKARSGIYVGSGGACFGYEIDLNAPGGLRVAPDQAETVRRIFELYTADACSIREIARRMEQEHRLTPEGRARWGKSTIHRILTRSTYAGTAHYNQRRVVRGRHIPRPETEWVTINVTPIVSPETWQAAQARLVEAGGFIRRAPERFYLLAGMVRCAECGKSYVCQTHRGGTMGAHGKPRLADQQDYRHRVKHGHCREDSKSAPKLEREVWGRVLAWLSDPERQRREFEQATSGDSQEVEAARVKLAENERKRAKLAAAVTRLQSLYIDPDMGMTKAEYKQQREKLERDRSTLDREKLTLERTLNSQTTRAGALADFQSFAAALAGKLTGEIEVLPATKREVLQALGAKVLIDVNGTVEIEVTDGETVYRL